MPLLIIIGSKEVGGRGGWIGREGGSIIQIEGGQWGGGQAGLVD